jgi:hypothetical protein
MDGRPARCALFGCGLGAAVALFAVIVFSAAPGGAEEKRAIEEPAIIAPRAAARRGAANLPRGEVLLMDFLQQLADSSGEPVCVDGNVSPAEKISLERALDRLDAQAAAQILDRNGFGLTREKYRGVEVHWVQRLLSRQPRRRGAIVRPEAGAPSSGGRERAPALGETGVPGLRLYRRADGETSYLVTFETASEEEAAEVVSLIQTLRKQRK